MTTRATCFNYLRTSFLSLTFLTLTSSLCSAQCCCEKASCCKEPATAIAEPAATEAPETETAEAPQAEAKPAAASDTKKAEKKEWIQLFNGKNLDGWKVKITGYEVDDNYANTFRVEDGLLKVRYDKEKYPNFGGRFGHLFCEKEFSHYLLRVEYRFVGEQVAGGPGWAYRNSGIMIHGQTPESMGKDQKFPASIEVQLLGAGDKGLRPTANLCTPSTNVVMNGKLFTPHCINSKSKTYRNDTWVTVEVEVHGDKVIKHIVEGKTVLEYEQPQLDKRDKIAVPLIKKNGGLLLDHGTISLQSESHPVDFRKVEIKILKE